VLRASSFGTNFKIMLVSVARKWPERELLVQISSIVEVSGPLILA